MLSKEPTEEAGEGAPAEDEGGGTTRSCELLKTPELRSLSGRGVLSFTLEVVEGRLSCEDVGDGMGTGKGLSAKRWSCSEDQSEPLLLDEVERSSTDDRGESIAL